MTEFKVHYNKKSLAIRTIIACRYPLANKALCKILKEDKRIEIVSEVSNLIDLFESCKQFDFDILLLDVELRGLNLTKILGLVKTIKSAKIILLIDRHSDENLLIKAVRYGVRGCLFKDVDFSCLTKSLKTVFDGELWVKGKLMGEIADRYFYPTKRMQAKAHSDDITKTEIKVVKLILKGMTNKEIADELYVSEQTVKSHIYKVYKKLSLRNRTELMRFGFLHGFLP